MSGPKKHCRACRGTGWAPGPVKAALARADGSRAEYPTVVRCSCENSTTIPDDPPEQATLDRQSQAAGEPGENG
jgi:hypothetical protein